LQIQEPFCKFIKNKLYPLKTARPTLFYLLLIITIGNTSCGMIHNMFGSKSGCPSDGKNVGAERILSGEKVPKASKFKA